MKKVTRLLLVASVAAMGVVGFSACADDITQVETPPPPPPPPEDAELTIKSVENFQGENVNPDDVSGDIVVVFNVESGDRTIDEIQLVIDGVAQTCQTVSGSGSVSAQASGAAQAQQEVECVLATASIAGECTGEQVSPAFDNGERTIGGNLVLTDGTSVGASNEVTLNFNNDNFVLLTREGGQGVLEPVSDNRFFGGEDITFNVCPVFFDGTVVETVTLQGTDLGGDAGNAVDLGGGFGAAVTTSSPFVFTAALADNQDAVEDPATGLGHDIDIVTMETAEGENLSETATMSLFLDFTGPEGQSGDEEVLIDGASAIDAHYSAGGFSLTGVSDAGVGVDFAATVFDVVDAADFSDVLFGDAAGIEDVDEDDLDAYHAIVETVVDRLGNGTTVDADGDADLDTEAPAQTVVDWGVDKTAPETSGEAPATAGIVLNDVAVEFSAADPDLASGDPGSGVDEGSATAADEDDNALPIMGDGSGNFTIDITAMADGAHVVTADVPDFAVFTANVGMTEFDFILDTTAPEFGALDPVPSGSAGTDATSIIQRIGGTITDANAIASAVISVFADGTDATGAGGDDTCTTGDYLLSVSAGEIDRNEVDVATDTNNIDFEEAFQISEPTSASVTVTYCFIIEAEDEALDRNEDPNPNTSSLSTQADVTWNG